MECRRIRIGWRTLALGLFWTTWMGQPECLRAQPCSAEIIPCTHTPAQARTQARQVPLDELPACVRENVRHVLEQPTIFSRGPAEEFDGHPELYHWLLDHPDRAARAWQRLGAPCMDITARGEGWFGWTDGQGSDVRWETIYRTADLRIWYAEGAARPGTLLPQVPMRAVVVLHHTERHDSSGRTWLWHQADVFLQTDSKTAALVARLLGPSVPRLAEQGVTQLEMFFSALLGYFERHPERAEKLLSAAPVLTGPEALAREAAGPVRDAVPLP